MTDVACLPVLTGHKTARERFAGATRTWTCEGMMGDGKALQMGTSHELGQNFAKAFGITFSNTEGTTDYVWQTSWGVSTRLIGALVMGHGDDFGLRLPPALAPAQVVVLVIKEDEAVRAAAESVVARAAGGRSPRPSGRSQRDQLRSAQRGLGAQGGARPGGDRATGPLRGHRDRGHPAPADQGEGGAGGSGPDRLGHPGPGGFRADGGGDRRPPRRATTDVATLEEAIEAGGSGFARIRLGALGIDGEDRLAAHALSVRCLQRHDGSLAELDDTESDLTAVVGRSY